jgi:glutamate synthase domain-containing protein 2
MTEERGHSKTLVYQYLPSRYGMNPDDLRKADAIEIVVGQGAKPGGGGMLLGQKIDDRVAEMRTCPRHRPALGLPPPGLDRAGRPGNQDPGAARDHRLAVPIYVKVGGSRPYYDTALAVKAGADVVVIDGMQGGTAATQDVFIEHVGIPTLPASAKR